MLMPATVERVQHLDLQFFGLADFTWLTVPENVTVRGVLVAPRLEIGSTLRAAYAELARQYDARQRVPDLGGGLPGEINPI
jgi:hypothetical protein